MWVDPPPSTNPRSGDYQGREASGPSPDSFAVAHPNHFQAASSSQWFSLRVRPQREASVERSLRRACIESFLPLDGEKPLFPGYLFARFALSDWRVKRIEHVYEILGTARSPVAVTPAEIAEVRRVLQTMQKPAERSLFRIGDPVAIQTGAFAGQHGIVARLKGNRLAVTLELLRRQTDVTFDAADVAKAA